MMPRSAQKLHTSYEIGWDSLLSDRMGKIGSLQMLFRAGCINGGRLGSQESSKAPKCFII